MFQGYEITHLKICATKIEHPRIQATIPKRLDVYLMPSYDKNGILVELPDLIGQVNPVIINAELFDEIMAQPIQKGNLLNEYTRIVGQFLIDKDLPQGWGVIQGVLEEC